MLKSGSLDEVDEFNDLEPRVETSSVTEGRKAREASLLFSGCCEQSPSGVVCESHGNTAGVHKECEALGVLSTDLPGSVCLLDHMVTRNVAELEDRESVVENESENMEKLVKTETKQIDLSFGWFVWCLKASSYVA